MSKQNTTANEPTEAIDPGGTHPTQSKRGGNSDEQAEQKVKSGDRNTKPAKTEKSAR